MTESEQYATDTDANVREEEEIKPLEVIVTNQPKEKEKLHPEWTETEETNYIPTEEEIKEMTDAQ